MGKQKCHGCGSWVQKTSHTVLVTEGNLEGLTLLVLASGRTFECGLPSVNQRFCTERHEQDPDARDPRGHFLPAELATPCMDKSDAVLARLMQFSGSKVFEHTGCELVAYRVGRWRVEDASGTSVSRAAKWLVRKDNPAALGDEGDDELWTFGRVVRARALALALAKFVAPLTAQPRGTERALTAETLFNDGWWAMTGARVAPGLHASFFGFTNPKSMRGFFEVFCEAKSQTHPVLSTAVGLGLDAFAMFGLALWRMRSGLSNQFIAAFMGKDRSHLARYMDTWTIFLGGLGQTFVGIPPEAYFVATVLTELDDMGMPFAQAVGDASDFPAETPRAPCHAKTANQGQSDKIKDFAARALHLTTPCGLIHTATGLFLARTSELQALASLYEKLKELPMWVQYVYDKGIRNVAGVTPFRSFCFTPAFCKTDDAGKKKIGSVEDIISSRAIARARYVPEIQYARVKAWRLLGSKCPVERFHLMESTWWWALGFSNLTQRYLRPPDDVMTSEQAKVRAARRDLESRMV